MTTKVASLKVSWDSSYLPETCKLWLDVSIPSLFPSLDWFFKLAYWKVKRKSFSKTGKSLIKWQRCVFGQTIIQVFSHLIKNIIIVKEDLKARFHSVNYDDGLWYGRDRKCMWETWVKWSASLTPIFFKVQILEYVYILVEKSWYQF